MAKLKVSLYLFQGLRRKKIRMAKIGDHLIDKGLKLFVVNRYTGVLSEVCFMKTFQAMIRPSDIPFFALSKDRAMKKAAKLMREEWSVLPGGKTEDPGTKAGDAILTTQNKDYATE